MEPVERRDQGAEVEGLLKLLPAKVLESCGPMGALRDAGSCRIAGDGLVAKLTPAAPTRGHGRDRLVVDASQQVAVPSFEGADLRSVVERRRGRACGC